MQNARAKHALRLALLTPDQCVGDFAEARAEPCFTSIRDTVDLDSYIRTIKRVLCGYFKAQRDTFPIGLTEHLLKSLMQSETAEDEEQDAPNAQSAALLEGLQEVLVDWLEKDHARFQTALVTALHAAASAGFLAACNSWKKRLALGLSPSRTSPRLYNWAKRRGDQLLALLDKTTRRRITEIITKARKHALSIDETMRSIREYLDNITHGRAEMAARMEANNAVNEGEFQANKALGATAKAWITCRDAFVCPTCLRNEQEGRIPIEDPFPSGHNHPPAHPHCRCTIVYFGVTLQSALRTVGLMPETLLLARRIHNRYAISPLSLRLGS